jgi:catechol 2,3-dioxygenase-like lactoylglutathione lyase family enzyme
MTIRRVDHVGIVVDDLPAATTFFVELGLELQGEGSVEGSWVDRVVGLEGVRAEIVMVETPDGRGRLELTKFHAGSGRRPARAGEHPGHPPYRIRSRRHRRRRRWLASPRRGAHRRGGALQRQLSALLRPWPGGDHRRAGGADRLSWGHVERGLAAEWCWYCSAESLDD